MGDPFIFGVLIPLGALLLVALVPYFTPQRLSPAELGQVVPAGWTECADPGAILGGVIILLTLLALCSIDMRRQLIARLVAPVGCCRVRAYGSKAATSEPVGITPTLTGQAEYCLTCHADLPEISQSHPVETFGCVLCHGGEATGARCRPGTQHDARGRQSLGSVGGGSLLWG